MAVVVLLPDVPPTAMVFFCKAIDASNSLLLTMFLFNFLASNTSGTESSMAVETTTMSTSLLTPPPP